MKDDRLRLADEIIKSKDNMLKGKDDTIKSKDEIIKDKDNIIKSSDDIIKDKDVIIKLKNDIIKELNTDLFIAQGKLTLRSLLEEVETHFAESENIPRADKNQTQRTWTWMLTNDRYVKDAFEIKGEEDVRRWAAVAVSLLSDHGSRPLYTYLPHTLAFYKWGHSDDEVTFANRAFNLLNLNFIEV
jgi:hypothetical protein